MKDRQNDLIDRFFTGELTDAEERDFREQMATDKAFSKAVDLQTRLRRELSSRRHASPVGRLLAREAEQARTGEGATVTPLRRYRWLGVAVAVLLLLCAALWFSAANYSTEALIARFHEPILDDTQAGPPQARDLLREAKRAFFSDDFARAERLSAAIPPTDSVFYGQAQALNAYALFQQEKYPAAINQFTKVIDTIPIDRSFPAGGVDKLRWTRLLAHLGAKRENDAVFKRDLQFFRTGLNESYRKKALELEKSLGSGWRKLTN